MIAKLCTCGRTKGYCDHSCPIAFPMSIIDTRNKKLDIVKIERIIKEVGEENHYEHRDFYSQYNEGWTDACEELGNRILQYLKDGNKTK